jgi:hypothetical protein
MGVPGAVAAADVLQLARALSEGAAARRQQHQQKQSIMRKSKIEFVVQSV